MKKQRWKREKEGKKKLQREQIYSGSRINCIYKYELKDMGFDHIMIYSSWVFLCSFKRVKVKRIRELEYYWY